MFSPANSNSSKVITSILEEVLIFPGRYKNNIFLNHLAWIDGIVFFQMLLDFSKMMIRQDA